MHRPIYVIVKDLAINILDRARLTYNLFRHVKNCDVKKQVSMASRFFTSQRERRINNSPGLFSKHLIA